MGGIATAEQSWLSHESRVTSGVYSTGQIVTIKAGELAQAENEHALMRGISEFSYSVKNGRLYHQEYKKYFDELIDPPAHLRAQSYVPLADHVKENLRQIQSLIVNGSYSHLSLSSPSNDFQGEHSVKGQIYTMRRVGDQVLVSCTDQSRDAQEMDRARRALYGETDRFGDTTNGGGISVVNREDVPTRQEIIDTMRRLGNEDLAKQYEAAIYLGDNVSHQQYMQKLIESKEELIYKHLAERNIDLSKETLTALREVHLFVEPRLQEIREMVKDCHSQVKTSAQFSQTEDRSSREVLKSPNSSSPAQTEHEQIKIVNKLSQFSEKSSHADANAPLSSKTTQVEMGQFGAKSIEVLAAFSNIQTREFAGSHHNTMTTSVQQPNWSLNAEVRLAAVIDAERFRMDPLYRFMKQHEHGNIASIQLIGTQNISLVSGPPLFPAAVLQVQLSKDLALSLPTSLPLHVLPPSGEAWQGIAHKTTQPVPNPIVENRVSAFSPSAGVQSNFSHGESVKKELPSNYAGAAHRDSIAQQSDKLSNNTESRQINEGLRRGSEPQVIKRSWETVTNVGEGMRWCEPSARFSVPRYETQVSQERNYLTQTRSRDATSQTQIVSLAASSSNAEKKLMQSTGSTYSLKTDSAKLEKLNELKKVLESIKVFKSQNDSKLSAAQLAKLGKQKKSLIDRIEKIESTLERTKRNRDAILSRLLAQIKFGTVPKGLSKTDIQLLTRFIDNRISNLNVRILSLQSQLENIRILRAGLKDSVLLKNLLLRERSLERRIALLEKEIGQLKGKKELLNSRHSNSRYVLDENRARISRLQNAIRQRLSAISSDPQQRNLAHTRRLLIVLKAEIRDLLKVATKSGRVDFDLAARELLAQRLDKLCHQVARDEGQLKVDLVRLKHLIEIQSLLREGHEISAKLLEELMAMLAGELSDINNTISKCNSRNKTKFNNGAKENESAGYGLEVVEEKFAKHRNAIRVNDIRQSSKQRKVFNSKTGNIILPAKKVPSRNLDLVQTEENDDADKLLGAEA